jgi:hypothetical protein
MLEEPHHVRAIEHITVPDCIMVLITAWKRIHFVDLGRGRGAESSSESLVRKERLTELRGMSRKLKAIV